MDWHAGPGVVRRPRKAVEMMAPMPSASASSSVCGRIRVLLLGRGMRAARVGCERCILLETLLECASQDGGTGKRLQVGVSKQQSRRVVGGATVHHRNRGVCGGNIRREDDPHHGGGGVLGCFARARLLLPLVVGGGGVCARALFRLWSFVGFQRSSALRYTREMPKNIGVVARLDPGGSGGVASVDETDVDKGAVPSSLVAGRGLEEGGGASVVVRVEDALRLTLFG